MNENNTFAIMPIGSEVETIRHTTTTSQAKLFNALNGSAEKVADNLGETIDVVDIVVTNAEVNEVMGDENSPKVIVPCVHFFTADKRHISSISNGIVRSTKNLLECGIIPTVESPLKITFEETKTKKGTAHTFALED